MNDFLNPKSMLTPGAAGSMVMLITNALGLSFAIGKPQWLALGLSFIFGWFVMSSAAGLKKTHRAGFWFVNSLIIFSVSVGTAKFAADRAEEPTASTAAPAVHGSSAAAGGPDLLGLLVPSAVAQEVSATKATELSAEQQKQLLERLLRENQVLKQQLRSKPATDARPPMPPPATEAARLQTAPTSPPPAKTLSALKVERSQDERAAVDTANKAQVSAKEDVKQSRFFKRW